MKHLSYASSVVFFLALAFSLYWGYLAIAAYFYIIGWILFGSTAIALPLLFASKLRAIFLIDTNIKKVVTKRKVE